MAKKQGCAGKTAVNELVKWLISFLVSFAVLAGCICIYNLVNAPVPGEVFTGKAQGMFCEIVAEVTVADGKIVDVKLTGAEETPSLGGVVLEEMPAKIMEAQSTDVDGMTGATVTTDAVKAAVNDALAQAGLYVPAKTEEPTETQEPTETEAPTEEVTEAAASGEVFVGKAQGMFCEIEAQVTVADGKIVDVKLTGAEETPSLGGVVLEEMPAKIMEAQSTDVDGMTGATVTTDAVKAAVNDALAQAGLYVPAKTEEPTETQEPTETEAPTEEVTEAAASGEVFVGKAQGMFCEIEAQVTVADGKIVDVKLTGADETPSLGGVVLEEMPAKIMEAQSADVDGMTGATVTTDAVKAAVNDALAQAGLYVPTETEAPTAAMTANDLIIASYKATAENTYAVDYLEQDPYLVNIYEGFGFAKQYDSARGHEYSLEDVANTARPHPLANCLTCKTADFTMLVQEQGVSAYSLDFNEVMASMNDSIGCYNCHADKTDTGELVVTHDYFTDKLDMTGIDAATLACGQCHIEYYFEPDTKATTIPYTNTAEMTPEAMLAYYDAMDFADWTQPSTGARLLKAQHPEMETFLNGSIHAKFNLSCASCHMEKATENGVNYTSHNLVSPLDSPAILATCASCHPGVDMTEKVHAIQEQVTARETEVGNQLSGFKDKLAEAVASGEYTDEELDAIRLCYRHAQWFFDYVYVENSEGAHNSALAYSCLDQAAAKIEEGMKLFHAA